MNKLASQPDALLGWMGSLSDPTRLRLLRLLERHELGVVELCQVLQLPQSTVSRHLKVLSDQRWVRNRREGTTHLYRMILDELAPAGRKLWLLAREQTDGWGMVNQDEVRLQQRLRDRQRESEVFFAGAAGEWDKMRSALYGDSFTRVAMLCLLPGDAVVADLGCGTGALAEELADYVGKVIGVDNSAAMLKAAKKRIGERANVELRRGDLEAIPIEDGSVDAAMLVLVLTYVAEPGAVLREAARILKPGGKLVIVDLKEHEREDFRREMGQQSLGFEAGPLERMLGQASLTNVMIRTLVADPAAKGPGLFVAAAGRPS